MGNVKYVHVRKCRGVFVRIYQRESGVLTSRRQKLMIQYNIEWEPKA